MSKPHRSAEERARINEAKALLMVHRHYSEPEAHRVLQQQSMRVGCTLTEAADMIIRAFSH